MADELFTPVGRIVKTHGVKGEVSLLAFAAASLDDLLGVDLWFVPPVDGVRTTRLASWRPGPKGPIAMLEGIETIEKARSIARRELLARTDDLSPAWHTGDEAEDIVGMQVVDESRGELGVVDNVILTGANDVWVVHGRHGEVLIPVIDDVVMDVDDARRSIRVRLLPGLMPGEGESA